MGSERAGAAMRVFAVSNRQDLAYAASEESYREKFRCLMEAIAPVFSKDKPNLVVFTEDAGLVTAFIGSRGIEARKGKDSFTAMLELAKTYSEPYNRYLAKYGAAFFARALLLALTDTIWRPFYDTFSSLARRYGVYVLACTNVAEVRESADPQDVSFFGDPEHPERNTVYLPVDGGVWNTAFLFSPDGNIVHRTKKVNLVDLEENLLQLTPGSITEVTSYTIPGTTITVCTGISKDAFMDSFLSRVSSQGCTILLQPDANPGMWAEHYPYWQPEDWLGSTLGSLQEPYSILYNINPMMTGNFFDIVFDGQSAITGRNDPRAARSGNYVGCDPIQDPITSAPISFTTGAFGFTTFAQGGFILMGPWVMEDPGLSAPSLSRQERRSILHEKALALAPGGSEENRYLETILWTDLF